jgi:hypothetical protein
MISALGWNFVPIVLATQPELFTKREISRRRARSLLQLCKEKKVTNVFRACVQFKSIYGASGAHHFHAW